MLSKSVLRRCRAKDERFATYVRRRAYVSLYMCLRTPVSLTKYWLFNEDSDFTYSPSSVMNFNVLISGKSGILIVRQDSVLFIVTFVTRCIRVNELLTVTRVSCFFVASHENRHVEYFAMCTKLIILLRHHRHMDVFHCSCFHLPLHDVYNIIWLSGIILCLTSLYFGFRGNKEVTGQFKYFSRLCGADVVSSCLC